MSAEATIEAPALAQDLPPGTSAGMNPDKVAAVKEVSPPPGTCGSTLEPKAAPPDSEDNEKAVRHAYAVYAKQELLWETGRNLRYSFFDGPVQRQKKVKTVIKEWMKYINIPLVHAADKDQDAEIRITFDPSGGSWSYVGTDIDSPKNKGKPTMNLGWLSTGVNITDNERGVILHEFGHTFGLMHEHASPSRGEVLTILPEVAIEHFRKTQNWSPLTTRQQFLDVYNKADVSNFSKLDTESIMMYFMPGKLNKQNRDVPVNNKLSDLDKAWAVINYPLNHVDDDAEEWTLEHALEVAGVDDKKDVDYILSNRSLDFQRRTRFAECIAKKRPAVPTGDSTSSPISKEPLQTIRHGENEELFNDPMFRPAVENLLQAAINTSLQGIVSYGQDHLVEGSSPEAFKEQTTQKLSTVITDIATYTPKQVSKLGKDSPSGVQHGILGFATWGISKLVSNKTVRKIASEIGSSLVNKATDMIGDALRAPLPPARAPNPLASEGDVPVLDEETRVLEQVRGLLSANLDAEIDAYLDKSGFVPSQAPNPRPFRGIMQLAAPTIAAEFAKPIVQDAILALLEKAIIDSSSELTKVVEAKHAGDKATAKQLFESLQVKPILEKAVDDNLTSVSTLGGIPDGAGASLDVVKTTFKDVVADPTVRAAAVQLAKAALNAAFNSLQKQFVEYINIPAPPSPEEPVPVGETLEAKAQREGKIVARSNALNDFNSKWREEVKQRAKGLTSNTVLLYKQEVEAKEKAHAPKPVDPADLTSAYVKSCIDGKLPVGSVKHTAITSLVENAVALALNISNATARSANEILDAVEPSADATPIDPEKLHLEFSAIILSNFMVVMTGKFGAGYRPPSAIQPQHTILGSMAESFSHVFNNPTLRSAVTNVSLAAVDAAATTLYDIVHSAITEAKKKNSSDPLRALQVPQLQAQLNDALLSSVVEVRSQAENFKPGAQAGIFDWIVDTAKSLANNETVSSVVSSVVSVATSDLIPTIAGILLSANPNNATETTNEVKTLVQGRTREIIMASIANQESIV